MLFFTAVLYCNISFQLFYIALFPALPLRYGMFVDYVGGQP
jgi:hypothetical protein